MKDLKLQPVLDNIDYDIYTKSPYIISFQTITIELESFSYHVLSFIKTENIVDLCRTISIWTSSSMKK